MSTFTIGYYLCATSLAMYITPMICTFVDIMYSWIYSNHCSCTIISQQGVWHQCPSITASITGLHLASKYHCWCTYWCECHDIIASITMSLWVSVPQHYCQHHCTAAGISVTAGVCTGVSVRASLLVWVSFWKSLLALTSQHCYQHCNHCQQGNGNITSVMALALLSLSAVWLHDQIASISIRALSLVFTPQQ